MKTLKVMMTGLALLLVCSISQAATAGHNGASKDEALETYLNAVVHGKLSGVNDVIDDDAQFYMKRGDHVNTLSKAQIIDALKSSENVEQDCQCVKSVLQDDDATKVMKVDMKYSDYTRTDVVTAEHVGSGWKITKVETSFK